MREKPLSGHVKLERDGDVLAITLARPRSQGDPAFAALEKRILDRVLQKSDAPEAPSAPDPRWLEPQAHALRWAV